MVFPSIHLHVTCVVCGQPNGLTFPYSHYNCVIDEEAIYIQLSLSPKNVHITIYIQLSLAKKNVEMAIYS